MSVNEIMTSQYGLRFCGSKNLKSLFNRVEIKQKNKPLATVKIGNKKVRIYSDIEADCGKRRKKRDKLEYFAGYRKHTLIAIDPKTGQNYPLFSLVAPGNHHDNQFTPLILAFSRAMGLEIKLSTVDEDYADAEQNEAIKREYGVTVIIPPDKQAKIPEDVDSKTLMNLLLYLTIFASHASYCRSFHIF